MNEICNENGKPIDINDIPEAFNNHFTDLGHIPVLSQNIPACSTPPESYISK